MDASTYSYKGKLWSRCLTTADNNSFFHSAFGMKTNDSDTFYDKQAKFRRMRWATFLTYFENEDMPSCLADILRKCTFLDGKHSFSKYVSDIMVADRAITIEEIPILATLENTKVVVLSSQTSDSLITIEPNHDILGKYPIAFEKPKEVVLCLEGNVFARLELVNQKSSVKSVKTMKEKKADPNRYRKGGSAGSKGVKYQVNLLALVILNALKRELEEWKLSTEDEEAGKFDDIVVEWSKGTVLIQSKHKENNKKMITLEELTSTNSKNNDFSLPKYFLWYQMVKTKFKVKNVIILTNTGIHQKALTFLDNQEANSENLLYYEGGRCTFYTLNDTILPILKEKSIQYYQLNFKNKGIEESVITDENLKDFLKHLQLYFNYPSVKSMGKIIETSLSSTKGCSSTQGKINFTEMYSKVMDWFQQTDGFYFTETHAKAMFSEIWRDKYWQKLEHYKLTFCQNNFNFQGPKQTFHVTTSLGYLLQLIKICQSMQNNKTEVLLVNPDDDVDTQKMIVQAFIDLPLYVYLVIIRPQSNEKSVTMENYGQLQNVLENRKYKKIIYITEDKMFAQQIKLDDVVLVDGSVTFEEFSKCSQERLLNEENIIFQGRRVNLAELFPAQTVEDYGVALNQDMIETLLRGEEIKVGTLPSDLDDRTIRYYINRTLKRKFNKVQETEESESENRGDLKSSLDEEASQSYNNYKFIKEQVEVLSNETKEQFYSEENIFDVNDKLILIADSAGMGKSTILTKLALTIKEHNPQLWIIKLELNDYTTFLRDSLEKEEETVSITELLNSRSETELTNHLERYVFSINQKVVLMLDGIDEISPDYTGLILNLLKQCQEMTNFRKIFVTTRPHMIEELQTILKVEPFILQPFTEENQLNFLTKYWTHNLKLKIESDVKKCGLYAKTLIHEILRTSLDQSKENHFVTIPLYVRMAADIFQENTKWDESTDWGGCKEYIIGDEDEPKLTERMNVTRLYDLFIEKKRDIFMVKGNPTGNPAANQALKEQFNQYIVYHQIPALEMIINRVDLFHFSSIPVINETMKTNILKIGIMQLLDDKLHFVHRTFADYFVAKVFLAELQWNRNVFSDGFLIEVIFLLPQFNVTRTFFDSLLQKTTDSLPSNIFERYRLIKQKNSLEHYMLQSKLMHILAEEGCLAILQLIVKCIDFKPIKGTEMNIADFYDIDFEEEEREHIFSNTLNVLRYITGRVGVNLTDEEGWTPLHSAARNDHLEIVKFLIEQGAELSGRTKKGSSALHLAADLGGLSTVKYLAELGIDVNSKDNDECTALQRATRFGRLDTVKFLLEFGVDFNSTNAKGYTILHTATFCGHLDVVRFFVEYGLNVDVVDINGCTLLHLAAMNGYLDIVKFLLSLNIDFNKRCNNGQTALQMAARHGHLDIIKFLVQYDLDFKVINSNGLTLLHLATMHGRLDTIKFLLQLGIDLNARANNEFTALHIAAATSHLDTIKFFLELDVDLNARDKYGNTVLQIATYCGQLGVVKLFIEHGLHFNIIDSRGSSLLHLACRNRHLDIVRFLLELGIDYNIRDNRGCTALYVAASKGYVDIIKLLHEFGADFSISDNMDVTTLQVATYFGQLDAVRYIITCGLDFNIKDDAGSTLLHLSCEHGHLGIIKFLLELGIDYNSRNSAGFTALHIAAENGHVDVISRLLDFGLDPNINDNCSGFTALHVAARHGQLSVVKSLFKFNVDFTVKDNNGCTIPHLSAQYGHFEIVKFLMENRLDFNVRDGCGRTPIILASAGGYLEILKYLVECDVNFKITDNDGCTALHVAAKNGNLETVKFLLKVGLDANMKNIFAFTALHSAIPFGHLNIVKAFLEFGVDFNIQGPDDITVQHLAALQGQLEIFRFLVNHGLDVNVTTINGLTPLHLASVNGHLNIIKLLLDIGIDPNIRDKVCTGFTALHMAAQFGHLEIIKLFVQHGLDYNLTDNYGHTLLHLSSQHGHLNVIKYLATLGLDCNIKNICGSTALHTAAQYGHLNVVQFLVEGGVDSNIRDINGCTALQLAIQYGQILIVTFLVQYCLDYNATSHDGSTLLHSASKQGYVDTVKLLLEVGVDSNIRDHEGRTALHIAAIYGQLDTIKLLVGSGLDINVETNYGLTLLHVACMNCDADVVKFLLEQGINFTMKDNDGRNALHIASQYGRIDIVKVLVKYGLDIYDTANFGFTPLHLAGGNGHLDIVKLFFELGVDFNIKDDNGRTVLHISAQNGHIDVVKFLTEFGLNTNVTSSHGHTSLHLACDNGHLHVVKFLLESGADFKITDGEGLIALHLAAHSDHLEIVKYFVEFGVNFSTTYSYGRTLLYLDEKDYLYTVQLLLKHHLLAIKVDSNSLHCTKRHDRLDTLKLLVGFNSNVTSSYVRTPLHLACQYGYLDIVKFLFDLGEDSSVRDNNESTALQTAVVFGQLRTVNLFVEYGLHLKATNLLHLACRYNHLDIVKFLIELGVDFLIRDDKNFTALQTAVVFGHLDIVKFLSEYDLDFNVITSNGQTLLHLAGECGYFDIIKFLSGLGVDFSTTDNNGFTVLQTAVYFGHLHIAQFFLERGLDFKVINSNNGRTLLHSASECGNLSIVKYLFKLDIDFNITDNDGFTALHLAAQCGQLDTVKFLVVQGLDFNVTSSYGYTPLHLASENGHLDTVKYLLEVDVDYSIRDADGFTILQTAVYFSQLEVVKFLVNYGLDFNVVSNCGSTLLHSAAISGQIDTVKFLLELGMDCNIRDQYGSTPLHLAVRSDCLDTVKSLVESGADLYIKNNKCLTALEVAVEYGQLNIVKFLEVRRLEYEHARANKMQGMFGCS